jgi:hypothetical protein
LVFEVLGDLVARAFVGHRFERFDHDVFFPVVFGQLGHEEGRAVHFFPHGVHIEVHFAVDCGWCFCAYDWFRLGGIVGW